MELKIKEIKELIIFIALLINGSDKATKNGLGIDDITSFMPALLAAPQAFTGLAEMGLELKDLNVEGIKELEVLFGHQLDLEDDKLEGLVEKSIGLLVQIIALVKEIKGLKAA